MPTVQKTMVPRVLRHEEGEWFSAAGDAYRVLVPGSANGGRMSMIEIIVHPGGGPPPHIHRREEETFYVLEGTVQFWVDGKIINAPAGSTVFAPRDVPHRFCNVTTKPARFLVVITPANLDPFFAEFSTPIADRNAVPPPPSPEQIGKLLGTCGQYGIEIVQPT